MTPSLCRASSGGRPATLLAVSLIAALCLVVGSSSRLATSPRAPAVRARTAPREQSGISYETKWFMQLVDHFAWANQDTWLQRYLVNQDHWCGPECPILFYTGNEGDIEVFANNTGWMWENAAELRAMLVFAEHRYYGKSMPYNIDPTQVRPDETDKLGYLSSEQALADFARLAYELKTTIYQAKRSPIITVGGSYGGMLAAWMRMKYPNLVAGALAGSAPILQFVGEYECQTFMAIVTKDYEGYSLNCSTSIAKSWSSMRELAAEPAGLERLGELFKTCSPMAREDVAYLSELLSSIWVNMAMTDYANPASFLSKMPAYPIRQACARLSSDPLQLNDEDLLAAISLAAQVYTNSSGALTCLDIKRFLFDPMDVLWDFQSCTEMVMPICSTGLNDMFDPQPFNLTEQVSQCKARWGVQTQVNKVRTTYGDKQLAAASNIIFSSCSRDPWSAGCPQDSVEARNIHAIKIAGACHHEDLRPAGPGDTDELRKARQLELSIIKDWIREHQREQRKLAPAGEAALAWTSFQ